MFKFGENWASFSKQLDETRIEEAMKSLTSLFGENALRGKSFLDIGCGSGLFSIAAVRLGAQKVVGVDVDPISVAVSETNATQWLKDSSAVFFRQLSVLDADEMKTLGQFDAVYSWGVLHHTGNMALALKNAAKRVAPGGLFMVAIYNRHWSSRFWKFVKWFYNRAGRVGQKLLIWIFTPVIFIAKWLVTFRNPFRMRRGMDFMHNVVDWVGGYPYEYASIEDMVRRLDELGFTAVEVRKANTPIGCNEFICRHPG